MSSLPPPAVGVMVPARAATATVPARIAVLEALWAPDEALSAPASGPGPAGSYRARIDALEMLVAGETSAGGLLARLAVLEELSG